eukprot:gene6701-13583_t
MLIYQKRSSCVLTGILSSLDCGLHNLLTDDGSLLVKLDKALYGCIEAAKLWYRHLRSSLESHGFIGNSMDICLFNKTVDGVQITIVAHVDDLMITSLSSALLDDTVSFIERTYKAVKCCLTLG